MKTLETQKDSETQEFAELVKRGVECWQKAGEIVTKMLEADPDWVERASKKTGLSVEAIMMFDRIGRRQLHAELILSDAPGIVALRGLPYQMQVKHSAEPIDVLVHTDAGWDSLKVDARNMTKDQVRMVFHKASIRSLAGQRAWLESKSADQAAKAVKDDSQYRIVSGQLVILGPCKFTRVELARLMVELS